MNFFIGFLAGLAAAGVLLAIARHRGYIALGKGARADQVDDDLKAARDGIKKSFD